MFCASMTVLARVLPAISSHYIGAPVVDDPMPYGPPGDENEARLKPRLEAE
jgi:hypothetical protein